MAQSIYATETLDALKDQVRRFVHEEVLPNYAQWDKDEIFPIKNIKNSIIVKNGTHIMILNKAKTISKILERECFLLT